MFKYLLNTYVRSTVLKFWLSKGKSSHVKGFPKGITHAIGMSLVQSSRSNICYFPRYIGNLIRVNELWNRGLWGTAQSTMAKHEERKEALPLHENSVWKWARLIKFTSFWQLSFEDLEINRNFKKSLGNT